MDPCLGDSHLEEVAALPDAETEESAADTVAGMSHLEEVEEPATEVEVDTAVVAVVAVGMSHLEEVVVRCHILTEVAA